MKNINQCHVYLQEKNIRLSSKEFHNRTESRWRKKRRASYTRRTDDAMKRHREAYTNRQNGRDWLGPRSPNYDMYAQHILRFFNRAIEAYTHPRYALQDFHQYMGTQRELT